MMYLTYDRYAELGGRVSMEAYPLSSARAEILLGEWTAGRLATWPKGDAAVEVALVEIIDAMEDGGGREVTSFSNGVDSFSFASSGGGPYGELYERVCAILPAELTSLAV